MADLHIIGSAGVVWDGLGIIYRKTDPYAIVGSGGIQWNGVGVVVTKKPAVTAVVGSAGVAWGGDGIVSTSLPTITHIIGSAGIQWDARGDVQTAPVSRVLAIIGSAGVRWGGGGIVQTGLIVPVPSLSIVGAAGIFFGGQGVVGFFTPPVLAVIGSAGIQWGEFRVPELTVTKIIYPADMTLFAIVGSAGLEFGGTGVIEWSYPPVYAVPVTQIVAAANIYFGGNGIVAFITPQILEIIGDAGIILGSEPDDDGVFETYVLTGSRGEPSAYSNFPFNSYAKHREQYYGAGPGGIYLLAGEDDAGAEIHAGVRIGPINFGTHRPKRVRLLRCGGENDEAEVKVSDDQGNADYAPVIDNVAAVSREVEGREIFVEISDFQTLDHLEIIPLVLAKR